MRKKKKPRARKSKIELPKPILKGDRIRIVAPSSPFERSLFQQSKKWIQSEGFEVAFERSIFSKSHTYLAGNDNRRVQELWRAFSDQKTKAIFFARGGYGLMRLLQKEGSHLFPKRRVIVMGYSDSTAFLNPYAKAAKTVAIHGPLMAGPSFLSLSQGRRRNLFRFFQNGEGQVLEEGRDFVVSQKRACEGLLWGGNLSMVAAMVGTPFQIKPMFDFLFLEEVREPEYRIDRMFAQLALSGMLDHLSGLILGDFTNVQNRNHKKEFIQSILRRYISKKTPIFVGVRAGHTHQDVWLPIGGHCFFDRKAKMFFLSPWVRSPHAS